jgi:hypothetical protein
MKELSVICKIDLLNLNSVASYSTSSAAVRTGTFFGTGAALFVNFHKEPCWSCPPQSAMRPRDALRMQAVIDEAAREDTRPRCIAHQRLCAFVSECSALREQYHFGVSSFGFLSSFVFRIFSFASPGAPANETAHYQTWHGTHMRFQRPACAPRRVEGVLKLRHWRGKGARRGDNAIQTGIGASQLKQTTK